MIYLAAIIIIFLSVLLQSTVFQWIPLAGVVPNLILASTVCMAYLRGRRFGIYVGFLGALLMDILFSTAVGLNAFLYMLIGYLTGFCSRIYFKNGFAFALTLIGGGDLLFGLLYYVLNFLLRGRMEFGFYFTGVILPEILYTILAGFLLYGVINPLNRFLLRFEFREE